MDNWKAELIDALQERGESLDDIEFCTMTDAELVEEITSGFNLKPFVAWTANTVYFTMSSYDAYSWWVSAVSRNPDTWPPEVY